MQSDLRERNNQFGRPNDISRIRFSGMAHEIVGKRLLSGVEQKASPNHNVVACPRACRFLGVDFVVCGRMVNRGRGRFHARIPVFVPR